MVQELSEELNGRLSPISFDHRHVDIIYEDHTGRGAFRPNAFLTSLLFQFGLYSLLSSVRVCLRRERELNRGQSLFLLICWDIVLHNYTFADPSAPCEKYGFTYSDKHLQDCGVSNCLHCRDHYWEEWKLGVVGVCWYYATPMDEALFFLIVVILKDSFCHWEVKLGEKLSHNVINESDWTRFIRGTKSPNEGKTEIEIQFSGPDLFLVVNWDGLLVTG